VKTYQFKLYQNKRNRYLYRQINTAAMIYNHCIALHKRYYKLFHKTINAYALMKHIAKLKRLPKYVEWNTVGSQAIQDIIGRIDKAYKLFFRNHKNHIKSAPPSFKKVKKYKSFTLKQEGYKFFDGNRIRIQGRIYKYFKSQQIEGKIKTVTVKRDTLGDLYLFVVTDIEIFEFMPRTGNIVGYDFGMKTFLKASDGNDIVSPEFFKEVQNEIKKFSRQLSHKKKGSNNRRKAKRELELAYKRIADKRRDFQFKFARQLACKYDIICIENLNINAMQKIWGKKINDLSFSSFVRILKYQSVKFGSKVVEIPRFYPSSKTCHVCGAVNDKLMLRDRTWTCESCNTIHDRDFNAAVNIERVGASTLGVEIVRPTLVGKSC
jgi:putative transposase